MDSIRKSSKLNRRKPARTRFFVPWTDNRYRTSSIGRVWVVHFADELDPSATSVRLGLLSPDMRNGVNEYPAKINVCRNDYHHG
jgi:hypothetical protein